VTNSAAVMKSEEYSNNHSLLCATNIILLPHQSVSRLFVCIRQVAAAICNCMFWLGVIYLFIQFINQKWHRSTSSDIEIQTKNILAERPTQG